jgi:hypothetical protein
MRTVDVMVDPIIFLFLKSHPRAFGLHPQRHARLPQEYAGAVEPPVPGGYAGFESRWEEIRN